MLPEPPNLMRPVIVRDPSRIGQFWRIDSRYLAESSTMIGNIHAGAMFLQGALMVLVNFAKYFRLLPSSLSFFALIFGYVGAGENSCCDAR